MKFLIVWLIGFALTVVTRIVWAVGTKDIPNGGVVKNRHLLIAIYILISICLSTFGAIMFGGAVATFWKASEGNMYLKIFIVCASILIFVFMYALMYLVLGLYNCDKKAEKLLFILVFGISCIIWTNSIYNYNTNAEIQMGNDPVSNEQGHVVCLESDKMLSVCSVRKNYECELSKGISNSNIDI